MEGKRPKTGLRVHAKFDEQSSDGAHEGYHAIHCLACKRMHWVNPKTGQTLSSEKTLQ
jgi:hypothetical protein